MEYAISQSNLICFVFAPSSVFLFSTEYFCTANGKSLSVGTVAFFPSLFPNFTFPCFIPAHTQRERHRVIVKQWNSTGFVLWWRWTDATNILVWRDNIVSLLSFAKNYELLQSGSVVMETHKCRGKDKRWRVPHHRYDHHIQPCSHNDKHSYWGYWETSTRLSVTTHC